MRIFYKTGNKIVLNFCLLLKNIIFVETRLLEDKLLTNKNTYYASESIGLNDNEQEELKLMNHQGTILRE